MAKRREDSGRIPDHFKIIKKRTGAYHIYRINHKQGESIYAHGQVLDGSFMAWWFFRAGNKVDHKATITRATIEDFRKVTDRLEELEGERA